MVRKCILGHSCSTWWMYWVLCRAETYRRAISAGIHNEVVQIVVQYHNARSLNLRLLQPAQEHQVSVHFVCLLHLPLYNGWHA
jgi:hypothetical protein